MLNKRSEKDDPGKLRSNFAKMHNHDVAPVGIILYRG